MTADVLAATYSLVAALLAARTSLALSDAYAVIRAVRVQIHRDDVMALQMMCKVEYKRQATLPQSELDMAALNFLGGYGA